METLAGLILIGNSRIIRMHFIGCLGNVATLFRQPANWNAHNPGLIDLPRLICDNSLLNRFLRRSS